MNRVTTTLSGLALLATITWAGAARAAEPATPGYPACSGKPVSAAESDSAHTKYIAGRQDLDEGNYESAARRFRDAYALDCTKHELLLKVAQAYQGKGDKKGALVALETYLERVPASSERATYQARIDNLKKDIAREEEAQRAARAASAPAPATPAPPRGHSVAPWIVVGVGGAAVVTGLVVALTAPSLPARCDEAAKTCPKDATADERSTAARSVNQPIVGWSVLGGGAALVAGGLLWHFLEPTGPRPTTGRPRVVPQLTPGFAGVGIDGAF